MDLYDEMNCIYKLQATANNTSCKTAFSLSIVYIKGSPYKNSKKKCVFFLNAY